VIIRFATIQDLPAIVGIFNQAIRSRCATGFMDEFSADERTEWFNQHDKDTYPVYVLEMKGEIVGFGSLSPYRPGRKAMSRTAEVSFFLEYSLLGRGLGSALLEYMIADCPRLGINSLIAILLDINQASIALLKKFGFKEWGRMPGIIYFEDKICDHLYFGLTINN